MSATIIGACGLTCSQCEAFVATQAGDAAEIEGIAAKWTRLYGMPIPAAGVWCDGCMTAGERKCGHTHECDVRACVVERGLANCAACADYGCQKLEAFLAMAADSGARETLESLRA
jgi:hypothetical protein